MWRDPGFTWGSRWLIMLPVLYSFRRCPYAIRARLALRYAGLQVVLREVVLADKPDALLMSSPKGTVPVLVLADNQVIDESLEIMLWALAQNDPGRWLPDDDGVLKQIKALVAVNDGEFKQYLDQYKYADRFPQHPQAYYRDQALGLLQPLEQRLGEQRFLFADQPGLADMAIFPFIRQFAHVDKEWFYQSPYKQMIRWLDALLQLPLFAQVMHKYPKWRPEDGVTLF